VVIELVAQGSGIDRTPESGVLGNIRYLLAIEINHSTIIQAFYILFGCPKHNNLLPLN
jgi:hypothetical protein